MTPYHVLLLSLLFSISGCASSELPTLSIYDTPGVYVRLEVDSSWGTSHSHPADFRAEQIAQVLSGLLIEEPLAKLPLLDDTSRPRRHPAFTEAETRMLAPLLAMALQRATPEEIVSFYESHPPSGMRREVTSGGLFVEGNELHVVLSNYRSPTHYMADPGVADTTDDRLVPMRSIAPQRGRLDFDPASAKRETAMSPIQALFHRDRREIIILPSRLTPIPSHATDVSQ